MEIRCEKCNKLFRVSDDKITGKGIKFACSRCGEAVRITREEFETYTLSKTTVSALDMFEPKPKPGAAVREPAVAKAKERAQPTNALSAGAASAEQKGFDRSSSSIPDFLQEKEEPSSAEPNFFEESSRSEVEQPVPEPHRDLASALAFPSGPESAMATKPQTGPETTEEPEPKPKLKQEAAAIAKPRPVVEPKPASQPKPEQQRTPATPVVPSAPKREPARPPVKQTESEGPTAEPSHSGRMVLVLLSAVVLLGAAGYGVYKYALPLQKDKQAVTETASIDGLRIINPSGSVESNGDLLISGAVENLTDKERSGWYVVVDVYDAQGTVLNKIRVLNGKQLYTRKDYDVLGQRGSNVQELKAKILQEQGVIIPAKGSVPFEMRYLQPPTGIASFNAVLQPFDPARLFKEIEEEAK